MITRSLVLLLTCLLVLKGFSQPYDPDRSAADTTRPHIKAFEENDDGSVYTGMYEILKGLHPISYVGFFPMFQGWNRSIPLREGEGRNGYLIEANLDQVFPLWQGRNQSSDFFQRARIAFRYAPAFRMTLDSSLPVLPISQKVGVELDYALWNNYTQKENIRKRSTWYAEDNSWINKKETFKVVHLMFSVMHYSNGQAPGVYYQTLSGKRNDYKKGDFSTNNISLMGVYSAYTPEHRLYSVGLGYRRDGGIGDAFSFNPEQEKRFGKNRVLAMLQLRGKPRMFGKSIPWKDLRTGKDYILKNKVSHRTRIEAEYIIGNMNNFEPVHTNRLGVHFYYEFNFAQARTTGIVLHLYHGRDYLNIRYDDIVTGGSVGVSFNLMKYRPPRHKTTEFIVSEGTIRYDPVKRKNVITD